MKILVVEDDRTIAQTLEFLLSSNHYAVDLAADGQAAMQMAVAVDYDLVLLDVLLPKVDGIAVCQALRSQGMQMPILLLTEQDSTHKRANPAWSVASALNAGADDYVVKPFDPEELLARVQALLQRGSSSQPILTWGDLSLDPSCRRVTYETHSLSLTPKEYAIMELFLRHPQTVFSTRAILDHAWMAIDSPGEEAVRAHIKQLRQKLTAVRAPKHWIKTVYRRGYQLNPLYSSIVADQATQPLLPVAELAAVNEELRLTLEELQVAEEGLKQQNEQLVSAQHLLESEQRRYQDLFDFAPDAYLVTDVQGMIQEANCAAVELLQVERPALIGKPLSVFIVPAR